MVIFFVIPVQLPFYLVRTGAGSAEIGLALAISALAGAIVSLQYQKIKARFSFEQISGLVFLAMGLGYTVLAASSGYMIVLLAMLIIGIGLGLVVPNLNVWLVSVIPATIRGRAIGGLTMSLFSGQFLSPIFAQPIVGLIGTTGAFGVFGAVALLLGIGFVGLSVKRRSFRHIW